MDADIDTNLEYDKEATENKEDDQQSSFIYAVIF